MKRIAILAPGSRGDVQPYIALGRGLQAAGHEVRLVTHANFETLAASAGLPFYPAGGNVQDIVESDAMRARVEQGNFLRLMAQMAKEAERGVMEMARACLSACRGADLILGGMGGIFTGVAVAEKLALPFLQAYLLPLTPTQNIPGVLVPGLSPVLSKWLWPASHHLTRQVLWQSFRSADTHARRKILGQKPAPLSGPYHSTALRGQPTLYGFSPSVIPPPQDWGPEIQITGYWFWDQEESWTPPEQLTDFIAAGPTPVYLGFGSMSNRNPRQTAELVTAALQRCGQRAVLLSGWGGLQKDDLPASILMIDSAPHSWLFPRMAAVVHHGGAGTTAAGLRAGVPNIVIPFFGDQPFWGSRVSALGVGPQPIPRSKLTVERLAAAIQRALTDEDMRSRAAHLGEQIRAENGVAHAVKIIGDL